MYCSILLYLRVKVWKKALLLPATDACMSSIKDFYHKHSTYLRWLNAYWLVSIAFIIFTFVAGDSSLYHRVLYEQKIRNLEKEIEAYRKEIETNRLKLENLHTDKESLERFAREEYLMKKSNEHLFIIRDK
jgi:cell division protein FtsB